MAFLLWLLRMGLSAPTSIKVAVLALAVLGWLQFQHGREVGRLTNEIATLTRAVEIEQAAQAELSLALADVERNRDDLAATVRQQSEAVAAMAVRAERAEALASLRAVRLAEAGRARAEALRANTGPVRVAPGHGALNAWIAERVTQ